MGQKDALVHRRYHQDCVQNTIYTQQAAKPACQKDSNAKFSHLLLAQQPRTQFTHSKLPNPHARKTATQNFRTCHWHSSPEHSLYTARRQTRMLGRRKIFAPPIGTATPNTVYTQQGAKPACQEDITTIVRATPNDVYTQQIHSHTASCQTLSRRSEYCTQTECSEYCACHTDRSRRQEPWSSGDQACHNPF